MQPQLFDFQGQLMKEMIETKKEPKQVPVKINKELAKKSIINFHQSLKKSFIKRDSLEDKLVEVAGKVVGMVVEDNEKTLLIRQADDRGSEIRLLEKAMYFDKALITNAYWIKFHDTKLPIHSLEARGDIRDFFDL